MIESIISLLGGGLTGVVGSAISKYSEYKVKKLEFENKVTMAEISAKSAKLETESQERVAALSAESEAQRSQDQVLSASYEADSAKYTGDVGFVDFVRGTMRPAITLYLIGLTTWVALILYNLVHEMNGEAFLHEEVFPLWQQVVSLVLYLTTTAVTWWFGTRPATRR